ncbi:MAG: hypothetical protein KIT87_02480 [Anaerolineae bacterium]|nr:hypothetical protein [Anaerolineae bacterium]
MWRFPPRVALVLLLGLTVALMSLGTYSSQAVTAEPLEPTSTPSPATVRIVNVNVRVIAVMGCPGDWMVANIQSPSSAPFTLRISDTTRFLGAQCADIRVNDTLQVRGSVPLDEPTITLVTALLVQRTSAPTPAAVQTITFRGAIIGNPRATATGWEIQFNTEVSGVVTVTVPLNLLGGVTPRPGDKADVTAQRVGEVWLATGIKFLNASADIGFSGLIESFPSTPPNYAGTWKIAGRQLLATANTIVTGIPRQYRRATVVAEMQGAVLRAKSIIIDPTDAAATAFELTGRASINDQNPITGLSRLGCLTFTVDPGALLPPGIGRWNDLSGRYVRVTGSRSLGVTANLKADNAFLLSTPYNDIKEVEILGYVDSRLESPTVQTVQLQIGRVVIQVGKSLPNQDQALQGTVVRVHGLCNSLSVDDNMQATSIEVVSKPYVAFTGSIEVIEMEGNTITGFQIRPTNSNDWQHIMRDPALPLIGGNDPVVGGCLSGHGYYWRDGSIQAQRIEVIGCAPTQLRTAEEEDG